MPDIRLSIVEDDINLSTVLPIFFELNGFRNVVVARNGLEIIDLLNNGCEVDIILMDILLPGLNGFEVSEIIFRNYPNIYIIALTAHFDFQNYIKFKTNGGRGYVQKPFDSVELVKIISRVFQGELYFPLKPQKDYLPDAY